MSRSIVEAGDAVPGLLPRSTPVAGRGLPELLDERLSGPMDVEHAE